MVYDGGDKKALSYTSIDDMPDYMFIDDSQKVDLVPPCETKKIKKQGIRMIYSFL